MNGVYTMEFAIPSYLCDVDDRLHPWAAVRLCQEVSEYHTNGLHIGFADLQRQGRAWVLTRARYEFRRRPSAFEAVRLSTWSRGNDGLYALRDYEMVAASTGEPLISGTSYWPIIDMQTRRVVRLHELLADFPHCERCATGRSGLERLRPASVDGQEPVMEVTARYSMVDHTRHVNNAEYNKWIVDALHATGVSLDSGFALELNYNRETPPGDRARVWVSALPEGGYAAQVGNSTGVAVVARVEVG